MEGGGSDQPGRLLDSVHTEMQGKLRDIGFREGFDVWVADRGLSWRDGPLGEGCLSQLPVVAPPRTLAVMRAIDVIWFRQEPAFLTASSR